MVSRIAQWTLDVRDVDRMAAFWSVSLDYRIETSGGTVHLVPRDGAGQAPTIWLQPGAGPKQQKLRGHLDLRPVDGDVESEVARLIGLGAAHTDVGQRDDDPFVVLVDPEGNEFCVLRP